MEKPPTLEEPSYPGRSGGYVARLTGKLLHECATQATPLFLPAPTKCHSSLVYAGDSFNSRALYEVPGEFYEAIYNRIAVTCDLAPSKLHATRVLEYIEGNYEAAASLSSGPEAGIRIQFKRVESKATDNVLK